MKTRAIWQDKFNMLAKLNFRRTWNQLMLELSYLLSNFLRRPIVWGYPISFSLEPTNRCNLGCPECPTGAKTMKRASGFIRWDVFQASVDTMSKRAIYMTLYFQGEPFMHPQIFDMIKHAQQKKLYVATSTNAHYLDEKRARKVVESGLDKLIISLDGVDQKTYEAYRKGGDLDKVLEGIRNIVSAKDEMKSKKPFVELQFLVLGTNEHQIKEIQALARQLKVDKLALKTAQVYDFENGNPLIPKNEKYSRYRKLANDKYEIKLKMRDRCYRMWTGCVITFNGDVVPCCFDKDAEYNMGNIKETEIEKLWKSEKYQSFRRQLLKDRASIEMCRNCTEGLRNS